VLVKMFLSITLLFFGLMAFAQEPQNPVYTFQVWKEQQLLDAQNQVLRSTSHLNQLKSASNRKGEAYYLAERDLKRAQESQQAASSLQFDDYITIYLPTLQDQPEAFAKLVEKFSKDELLEVVKSLVIKPSKTSDAKHNHELAVKI
jgi:hypothetical protein